MTITAIRPTGEVILFKFCTDVEGHYRSAYTRSDGTFVSDAEVDPHIRCLYAGIDAGLASGGIVQGGYVVTAFRRVRGAREIFVSRIYFRKEEDAKNYVKELSNLVNPNAKVGWQVDKLKSPRPASDFDALDYEAKVREGIKQLRTRLGDANLDMPKVFAREGLSQAHKVVDDVAEQAAEAARKAQQRAEELAKAAQKGLAELEQKFDDFAKKQAEQAERLAEEIRKAVNNSVDENYKKIKKLTNELINADKVIASEEKNLEVLSNRLKRLKDPEKVKQTKEAIEATKRRLASAKRTKTRVKKAIEAIDEIIETSQKFAKNAGDDIVEGARRIDPDDVIDVIRRLD